MDQITRNPFVEPAHVAATMDIGQRTCGRCLGWADSPTVVEAVLSERFSACAGCPNHSDMHVVSQQYSLHQPRWWVVDGESVVPVWLVDKFRRKFRF